MFPFKATFYFSVSVFCTVRLWVVRCHLPRIHRASILRLALPPPKDRTDTVGEERLLIKGRRCLEARALLPPSICMTKKANLFDENSALSSGTEAILTQIPTRTSGTQPALPRNKSECLRTAPHSRTQNFPCSF